MEYKAPDGDWRTAWGFESFGIHEPVISLETYNQNIVPQILRFRQMHIHSNEDRNHKQIIEDRNIRKLSNSIVEKSKHMVPRVRQTFTISKNKKNRRYARGMFLLSIKIHPKSVTMIA